MKKLLAMVMSAMLLLSCLGTALAASPDWTEYDALIAEIKSTTDFAHREALMHQAEDILMSTYGVVPIYFYNDIYMSKPDFEGFYANAFGTKFFMYATNGDKTTVRLQLASEPDKLDPALNTTVDGACLAANSFAGLYTYDAAGQLVPSLASGYEMSEDGLTYVFTMREGLVWSDGTPLTAKDIEYSWKRCADPETASDYSYMYDGIVGYDENDLQVFASEDGKTFTVNLKAPCAYFLDLAAFPAFFAVPQHAVESAAGFKDADGNVLNAGAWALEAGFVTCGAYTLESWVHGESMTYVKNPNFWDAANVKLEKLELMLSADDTVIYAAYNAGDLDFIDTVPNDEIQALLSNPEFHIIDTLGTYYVGFNVKAPIFDNMTVEQANAFRQAISKLIDRQYIVDTVGQTGQKVATSYVIAGMADGNGGIFKQNDADYTFPVGDGYYEEDVDVEGAIELLKSIGYEFDANGMLSASTPIAFEYIHNAGSGHAAIAECLQQDLAVIGINMTIKSQDWNVFLNERKAGNYTMARNGWLADFNDPINLLEMWTTESGNNDCQFGR